MSLQLCDELHCGYPPPHSHTTMPVVSFFVPPPPLPTNQGLATAPVLYASYAHPSLLKAMERKFEAPEDVFRACEAVAATRGVEQTRQLAHAHVQRALDALAELPPSPYRTSLAALAYAVIHRSK